MDWIIEIVGKVVLAVGGAGVIIIAISSYISKIWAELFMKKNEAKYEKDIENYKKELETERDKYIALNEQIIYKNKILFETEFEIYKEITPKIINTVDALSDWLVKGKLSDDNFTVYNNKKSELVNTLSQYAAFIDKEIYNLLSKFCIDINDIPLNILVRESEKYDEYKYSNRFNNNIFMELQGKNADIYEMRNEVLSQIRNYLRSLATIG